MTQLRHAASGATVRKLRRAAVVVLAAGAMVTVSGTSASADVLSGDPLSGEQNTDQNGERNLHCANSEGVATVNVLGTVRKHTDCAAADRSPGSGPATVRRGRASAEAGDVAGAEYNTAQNGRQNQACGRASDIVVPLGETERTSRCTVEDASGRQAG